MTFGKVAAVLVAGGPAEVLPSLAFFFCILSGREAKLGPQFGQEEVKGSFDEVSPLNGRALCPPGGEERYYHGR
jgi:hypothetical protein